MATLVIMSADEAMALDSVARQTARRAARQTDVLRTVLRRFVERGGPVPVEEIIAGFGEGRRTSVGDALAALDTDDLIRIDDGGIDLAYPFSAASTPFVVRLPRAGERYACCAIDALGIAPMIGLPVHVRSRCHHCGRALEFAATPDGPGPDAEGVMLWIGKRTDDRCRAADSL